MFCFEKMTLKQLRVIKGYKMQEVADGVGVTKSSVWKWENGKGYPTYSNLKKLCDFFHVGIDEIDFSCPGSNL